MGQYHDEPVYPAEPGQGWDVFIRPFPAPDPGPPHRYQRFMLLPWHWWRHLPHLHIPVATYAGPVRCAICWRTAGPLNRRRR